MATDWIKRIEIRNGKRSTYRYRYELAEMGFQFDKGSRCWYVQTKDDPAEQKALKSYCKKKKLNIKIIDRSTLRDHSYRKAYLEKNNKEEFRCAYCGKKIAKDDMTVDHILSVKQSQSKHSEAWKRLLKINSINDINNLAPACSRCNLRKGSKGGIWIIRGVVGKNEQVRIIMNVIKAVMLMIDAMILAAVVINFIWMLEGVI